MKKIAILLLAALTAASVWAESRDIVLPPPAKSGGMPLADALAARATHREFSSEPLTVTTFPLGSENSAIPKIRTNKGNNLTIFDKASVFHVDERRFTRGRAREKQSQKQRFQQMGDGFHEWFSFNVWFSKITQSPELQQI